MTDTSTSNQDMKQEPLISDGEQYRLPTREQLDRVAQLDILTAKGEKVKFGTLCDGKESDHRRNIIIFIRHFFCSSCEEFVRTLSKEMPPTGLSQKTPSTNLTIIGCGDYSLISDYISRNGCKFEVYTDPTRAIYNELGMTCSFSMGEKKPEYIKRGTLETIISGTWNTLTSIHIDSGKKNQNGGEFVWIDGEMKWARRMKHTRDHAEIKELESVLDSMT